MICKICNKYNCENHSIDDQKEYEILISLKNIRKAEKGQNKMKTQHTPLRLNIDKTNNNWTYNIIGKGNIAQEARIAELNPYIKEVEQLGTHIVNCVNNHDALIRQLEIVKARIESERKTRGDDAVFMLNAQYDDICKVLSQAKGGEQ